MAATSPDAASMWIATSDRHTALSGLPATHTQVPLPCHGGHHYHGSGTATALDRYVKEA